MNRNLKTRLMAVALTTCCSVIGFAYISGQASADGIPRSPSMYYTGLLQEDGVAVSGTRAFTLRFWPSPIGGAELCTPVVANAVMVSDGVFRFGIGDDCTDVMNETSSVWSELQIGTEVPFERQHIGAVPYAVEAELAASARTAESGSVLQTVLEGLEARLAAVEDRIPPVPALSAPVPDYTRASTSAAVVPELQVSLTTAGGPAQIALTSAPDPGIYANIRTYNTSTDNPREGFIILQRDSGSGFGEIGRVILGSQYGALRVPCGSVTFTDSPPAGTHAYRILVAATLPTNAIRLTGCQLQASEHR